MSGVGDIGGFRHDDFTISPAAGMFTNPVATTVGSLDWAGQNPAFIVRAQSPGTASTAPCNYGAFSSDGGTSWNPFPTCATGANSGNGGTVAVDASGTVVMWTPGSGAANFPQFSVDNGSTWTATTGLTTRVVASADKVTPATFYAFDSSASGGFYSTTNSAGQVFSKVNTTPLLTGTSGTAVANWAKAGDLISAIYRSDNNGVSWVRINDDLHQYCGPTLIQADPRVYGRVYLGMNGRGIIYGDIAQ